MAIHRAHEGYGAVTQGDVQVFTLNGDFANRVHIRGAEYRIEKFAVERNRSRGLGCRGRRLRRHACAGHVCADQRSSQQ